MPVLSSFISYRPKRKKAQQVPVQVSSPFQTNDNNSLSAYGGSLHPYASPRVLDINNGPRAYYNTANTPRVQLNMELDPESLTDWFPTGFLNSAGAEGSGSYGVRRVEEEKKKVEEEEEEEEESADDVLADLEAMDASNFVGTAAWNNSKRPAPSPIKIPNTKTKTASVISSPDSTLSSGVSGTTLARALMANTFVLSPDSMLRQSRGSSMLTRVDSATLPRSEYSPYYRDRGLSMEFSAPPVPDNAELVYVAPQTTRRRPPDAPPSDASSSTPTSPKDLDNVLDYYSFADDVVNPQSAFSTSPDQQRFRLPFSPITEESSSQLSPPTPFNRRASIASRGSSKSAGRFFLGTTPGPSTGGARVDWKLPRDSSTKATLLPFTGSSSSFTLITTAVPSSSNNTTTNPTPSITSPSTRSISSSMHILSPTTSHPPIIPPPTTVFARLRSGSAPAPINIKAADPKVYFNNINVNTGSNTPNSNEGSGSAQGGFGGLDGVGVHRVEAEGRIEEERSDGEIRRNSTGMEQTFPETPSAFSPGFSIASPRVGTMGATPMSSSFVPPPSSSTMSVFIPSGSPHLGRIGGMGAGPSLAQQVLLTRAATSVHGARHSRQASLGRSVSANGLGGNPVGNGRQVNEKVEEEAEEKEQTQNAPAATKSPFPPKPNPPLFDTPPAPSHPHHHPTHKSPSSTPPQSPPQSPLPDTPPSIQHTHPPPPPPVPRPTPPTHTPLPASIPPPPTSVPPVPPPAPTHAHTQPTHNAPSISTPLKTTPKSNLTPTPNTTPAHTPAAPVLGTVSLPQMTPSPSPPVSVPELEVEVESEAGHNVGHDSNPDHQQELELRHAPDPRNLYLREPDTPSGYGSGSEEAVLAYTSPSPHEFGGGGGWRGSFGGSSEGSPGPQVSPLRDGDVLGDHQTEGVNPNVTANANVPSVMPTTTTTPTPPTRRILPFALPSPVPPSPSSVSISSPVYSPYDALSPPSYYAVIGYDYGAGVGTPSTSGSYDPTFQFGGGSAGELGRNGNAGAAAAAGDNGHSNSNASSSNATHTGNTSSTDQHQPQIQSPPQNANQTPRGIQTQSMASRRRTRPPLPAGPRRPVAITTRERGGSVSSVSSQQPSSVPSTIATATSASSNITVRGPPPPQRPPPPPPSDPLPPPLSDPAPFPPAPSTILPPSTHLTDPSDPYPQFAVPSPKWRGYTMDAAKWTFTSIELQGIVSRAIRASSEASGIRLLKLETLDGEIPREVERLQRAREEAKGHYRDLVRRREGVLGALGGGMGMGQENEERLEELKEVCQALDRTSEELHSADEQLAQLAQLIQGHSASALAMALRKLNASFLKQFAEAQSLRQQVEALAAERDEAWTQAVEVAADYEDLRTGRIVESPDAENRFERVVAVRKLSTRAAKAGLGLRSASGGRSIRRGSISSSRDNFRGFGANTPSSSSARTTMYGNDPPPVPPVPRHRPVDIKTNLPLTRSSTLTGVSTEFPTPSSDTRAMVRAQDELYDMLGIPVNDRARRSRSVIGLPGDAEPVASPSYSYYEAPPNTGRRASLPPPSAALPPDPYALSANSSIIWASDRAGWI